MQSVPDLKQILEEKKDNLHAFSKRHRYEYMTVRLVVERWWHRVDKKPHGGISRQILKKLRKEYLPTKPLKNQQNQPH